MSERFTADQLIASVEWMFPDRAECNIAHIANKETNWEMDCWCSSRYGRMALFTYPPLPGESGARFGINGRWARLGTTFFFETSCAAFEFRMRWG